MKERTEKIEDKSLSMQEEFQEILDRLPIYEHDLRNLQDRILANLVMVSEIPSPTFHEQERVQFLINRFTEHGLHNCSTDEVGNALGILPGEEDERNIIVVAHLDTNFDTSIDHTVSMEKDYVTGPGVGDNGLGLGAVVSLPAILDHLELRLKSNLVLMGSSRSLGRGDIEGLRFFLSHTDLPISAGVCIEGVKLGRISYASIGMMRCEISHSVPEEYDWTQFGAIGPIVTLNEVINKILEIPLPKRPRTSIVFGAIQGGKAFDKIASTAVLRFEIRSESEEMVSDLHNKIENIVAEVSSDAGAEVGFEVFAMRRPGGLPFAHPLATRARQIMRGLDIKARVSPSTSELAAFIHKQIPALTLGITNGENMNEPNETIEIDPIYKGITQLIGLILAIDRGFCDASE